MPIIKSAKKRVIQTKVRQARNYNTRTVLRKAIRTVLEAVKAHDKVAAEKALQAAYKAIDTAEKKNILHGNTAARRKSSLAHAIADMEKNTVSTDTKKKAAPKKVLAKKVEVKEEAAKEEVKAEEA